MFLDDERFPPDDGAEWIIVRDWDEVQTAVKTHGMPSFISFDHDLGDNIPTGYDIAKSLADMEMDGDIVWPDAFSYYVHSQNPIGKENISGFLDNYLAFRIK